MFDVYFLLYTSKNVSTNIISEIDLLLKPQQWGKKIDKKLFEGKPSMEEHQKKFDNFCDTIIDINWNKILYNRMSFISLAVQKFRNCEYLEIGCANNKCFSVIPVINKTGVDPENGGNIRDTSDTFFMI